MMKIPQNIGIILQLLFIVTKIQCQSQGESCKLSGTGETGTCQNIQRCPKVVADYRQKRIQPTVCGWIDFYQIVCCPTEGVTTTTTTTNPTPTVNTTKSGTNCQRYQEHVYEQIKYQALADGTETNTRKVDRCNHKKVSLIVGGTVANPREFPHMALIGYGEPNDIQYLCGGSLISARWILTAGHCSTSRFGSPKYVRLGEFDKTKKSTDEEDLTVTQIVAHPEYRTSSHYNDIALLKLDHDAKLSHFVRPICLPGRRNVTERNAIATGWGKIGWVDDFSDNLLKVTLELWPFQECYDSYGTIQKMSQGLKDETQICAGSRNDTGDTCQGDSGGPLQTFHPTLYCMYTQIGVTSFGKGCGLAGQPAVYTRVYPFISWIESVVWPN